MSSCVSQPPLPIARRHDSKPSHTNPFSVMAAMLQSQLGPAGFLELGVKWLLRGSQHL